MKRIKYSLLKQKCVIVSDNENYKDYINTTLIITNAEIGGRGYDSGLYPEALCSFIDEETGTEIPFSLYEYEFELV